MCNKTNKSNLQIRMLKFLILANMFLFVYLPSTATAYSTSFDFGPVAVGTVSTTTVTLHNEEKDPVAVTRTDFLNDGCSDFSFVYRSELKLIPAGGTLEIDVSFSPSAAIECSNVLGIWTGSPFAHTVALSGTGVQPRASAEDKIQEILDYLDAHLKGKGPGKSAENRFNTLHSMLETAAVLIKNGQTEAALNKLSAIYDKADDFAKPVDFIDEGSTTARIYSSNTLAQLIQELMILLESEAVRTAKGSASKQTSSIQKYR